ncbi:hypothetical protein TCAL_16718 [Tigriopus californicus]|uniref:Ionotropic glutamate receptor L-glutamate and glycine-binding domain-containing protein n=1 Tax=Tigriopus californicus TaxID=6832 RepID=A0A553PJC5_TIGCA|nr:hypothetical protein TCAL_16718 [Tigriopus californicus]
MASERYFLGYEESILANAFPQKPEFQVLYDRLKSNPGKYLYTRYEDVLEEAKTSQVVFHTFARPFTALLKQQPQLRTNLKVFAKQKPQPLGVIFPKNSPLVPMFKLGIRKMKERGLIDFLAKNRRRRQLPVRISSKSKTYFGLSNQQVKARSGFIFPQIVHVFGITGRNLLNLVFRRNLDLRQHDVRIQNEHPTIHDFQMLLRAIGQGHFLQSWGQKLKLEENGKIIEDYNLQGMDIMSQSVDWFPYTMFESDGHSYGYLVDLANSCANMFNFTLRSIVEPNDDWGMQSQFGNEVLILGNASPEKPEYYTLYDRLMDNQMKNLYSNYEEIMAEARSSQTKLELDGNAKIIENYDLQGTEIVSQSLDWFPYFTIEANGTSYGYLIDLTSYCAKMFNFTYRSIVEPNNDWGMQSQFGKNLSGVLGNVIQNKVDMSLSLWVWNENRDRNEVFILANASPEKPEFQTLYDRLIDEPEKNLYSNYEDVLSEARSSQTMFHVQPRSIERDKPWLRCGFIIQFITGLGKTGFC